MKKLTLLIFSTFYLCSYAQEEIVTNKFSYNSFSVTPTSIYFDTHGGGGLSFSGDVNFAYKKHIFSLGLSAGSEFKVLGGYEDNFEQINLLYGRELRLSKRLFLDLHVGLGYFSLSSANINPSREGEERMTTIGFPLMTKFRVMLSTKLSLGLQFQANINSVRTLYTTGIMLQWNRKNQLIKF